MSTTPAKGEISAAALAASSASAGIAAASPAASDVHATVATSTRDTAREDSSEDDAAANTLLVRPRWRTTAHTTCEWKGPGEALFHQAEFKAGGAIAEFALTLEPHRHGGSHLGLFCSQAEPLGPRGSRTVGDYHGPPLPMASVGCRDVPDVSMAPDVIHLNA